MVTAEKIGKWEAFLGIGEPGEFSRISSDTIMEMVNDIAPDCDFVKGDKVGRVHKLTRNGRVVYQHRTQIGMAKFILSWTKNNLKKNPVEDENPAKVLMLPTSTMTPISQLHETKVKAEEKINRAIRDLEETTGMEVRLDTEEYRETGLVKLIMTLNI